MLYVVARNSDATAQAGDRGVAERRQRRNGGGGGSGMAEARTRGERGRREMRAARISYIGSCLIVIQR